MGETLAALAEQIPASLQPQAVLYVGRGAMILGCCDYFNGKDFDPELALSVYETDFAPAFARYVLEESGAAVEDVGEGCDLIPMGLVLVGGEPYYRFDAAEGPGSATVKAQYFVTADGTRIKCVPIPWPEKLVPQAGGGVPQAFSYYLTSDLVDLPGRLTTEVQRYFDWSKL